MPGSVVVCGWRVEGWWGKYVSILSGKRSFMDKLIGGVLSSLWIILRPGSCCDWIKKSPAW